MGKRCAADREQGAAPRNESMLRMLGISSKQHRRRTVRAFCWRRWFGAAFWLITVAVGLTAGCGGSVIQPASLILLDSVTGQHYTVTVVRGAPTIAAVADTTTVSPDAELVDTVTGAPYTLSVRDGSLMLVAGAGSGSEIGHMRAEIGLVDAVTKETYELAVVSGALTLGPQ
jgi:hypothetical protein